MFERKTKWLFALALFAVGAALVYACGPDFPLQLLDDRKGTLLGAPFNSFYYEVARLTDADGEGRDRRKPPPHRPGSLRRSDASYLSDDARRQYRADTRNLLEAGLSTPQQERLAALSTAPDGDTAYARGQGLPEPQRLYVAALVDLGRIGQPCGAQAAVAPAGAASATGAILGVSGTRARALGASVSGKPAASAANTANLSILSATPASAASTNTRAKPLACPTPESLRSRAAARLEAILTLPVDPRAPRAMDAAASLAYIAAQRVAVCGRSDGPDHSDYSGRSSHSNRVNRPGRLHRPDRSGRPNRPAAFTACVPLVEAAHAAYARMRALATQGAPDPLDLADKSYGDEALLELRATTGQWCDWRSFAHATRCAAALPAANLKRAIRLYARQAARQAIASPPDPPTDNPPTGNPPAGDQQSQDQQDSDRQNASDWGGARSLRYIAHWALADARRATALIDDDLAQRLLVAYALALSGDVAENRSQTDEVHTAYAVYGQDRPDASRGHPGVVPNPQLVALVDAIRVLRARPRARDDGTRGSARSSVHSPARLGNADRLAALAYRVGRYDLAGELVRDPRDAASTSNAHDPRTVRATPSALAWWVRAKLALRRGDVKSATRAYAEAARAFPTLDAPDTPGANDTTRPTSALDANDTTSATHAPSAPRTVPSTNNATSSPASPSPDASIEPDRAFRLKGEQGVLALARGEYVEAFCLLYAASPTPLYNASDGDPGDGDPGGSTEDLLGAGYENDLAYMAERVLTVDELKTFVDAHVPATPPPAMPACLGKDNNLLSIPSVVNALAHTTGDDLRYLLARRLVREGRVRAALPYFPQDRDPRYADDNEAANINDCYATRPFRTWARAYGDALDAAQHARTDVARAQGWFDAATLAKTHGMELMGYEQSPDFENANGRFYGGSGREPIDFGDGCDCQCDADDAQRRFAPNTPAARADVALSGPYVTAGEKARYAASESRPYRRFHYRALAMDAMQRAADLLPPRSQAFAAVLCQATAWNVNTDPARAQRFYQQYVKKGAYVDFGGRAFTFGKVCPAPDFRAARFFGVTQRVKTLARQVKSHLRSTKARVTLAGTAGLVVLLIIAGGWRVVRRRDAQRRKVEKNEAKQDETQQGETKRDEATQSETKQDKAKQHEARTD